jgi:hypothetical protein
MLYATHRKCPLRTADKVLVVVSDIKGSVPELKARRTVKTDLVPKDT